MQKCVSLFFLGQTVKEIFKGEIFLKFFCEFVTAVADFFFPDNYRAVIKLGKQQHIVVSECVKQNSDTILVERKQQHIVVSESVSLTDFKRDCNSSFFTEYSVYFKH